MFMKKKEGVDTPSFFNPMHDTNRNMFANGDMCNHVDSGIDRNDSDWDSLRDIQTLLKDSLKYHKENKRRFRTVMTLFIGTEQVLYTARKSFVYSDPGIYCHVHGVLHEENESEHYIKFSTCHEGVSEFSVSYVGGCIRINYAGTRMLLPIVLGEDEYFQMQLLYPWLTLTYDEYEQFRSMLEFVSTDSARRFRYHYIRLAIDFVHTLINYSSLKLKIVNVKYLKNPLQE